MLSNNIHLQKYEIKAPDYDLVERPDFSEDKFPRLSPARYHKVGSYWEPIQQDLSRDHAKIMIAGDIACFQHQFAAAQQGDSYDFRYAFDVVKDIFSQSDLAVGNLETMTVPFAPYRTEKFVVEESYHCNAPVEFLEGVKTAGFDLLTNANNHDLDTGAVGIGETIDHVERFGFIQTGTFKTEKQRYELFNVHGFKVAFIAFATGHNHKRCNLTPEGAEFLLNDYSPEKAEFLISSARKDGAEVVITCIHWGDENTHKHNKKQIRIATELANMGCDCIIGSHPHVLQIFSHVQANGRNVPVFYSMGNFISHNTEMARGRAIIACINLKRIDGAVQLNCEYIPIFTSANYNGRRFVILPLPAEPADAHNQERLGIIQHDLGNQIEIDRSIQYQEYVDQVPVKKKSASSMPDLSAVTNWPVAYDNRTFCYTIHKGYAFLDGRSPNYKTSSCFVPDKILKTPVIDMKDGAFEGDDRILKIVFNRDIPWVRRRLFKNSTALEGFQLGLNTRHIQEEAFAGCTHLVTAVMRTGIQTIGPRAFAGCPLLRTAKIPPNVCQIADDAFVDCPKLTIYCEEGSYAQQYAENHNMPYAIMKLS